MTLAERLMEKGMEKDIKRGMERGVDKGGIEERQELAKNLLVDGIEIELIAKYTKPPKEDIQKIKEEM